MSFLEHLTEKSWLTGQGRAEYLHRESTSSLPTAKLGLRVLLAVITVLFSLVVVAYGDRMAFGDWRHLPEPWLLWLNTAVLVLSSVALQRATGSARRGQMDGVRDGLIAGSVLACAFLVGQLVVWQQLAALGYFAATNPASAFFYMITALHGAHLLGGLVACGGTSAKVWRGHEADQVRLSVELCTIYMHFLLVVWLVLFGLMLFT